SVPLYEAGGGGGGGNFDSDHLSENENENVASFLAYVLEEAEISAIVCSRSKTFTLLDLIRTFRLSRRRASPPSPFCPTLKYLIQMDPIEYEETYLVRRVNEKERSFLNDEISSSSSSSVQNSFLELLPFEFIEKDGQRFPLRPFPPSPDS